MSSKPCENCGKEQTISFENNKLNTEIPSYIEEASKSHKNAYIPWTIADDKRLEELYCTEISKKEICKIFERNLNAINARIKKLELEEKYGELN